MSWIFSYNRSSGNDPIRATYPHDPPLCTASSGNVYVAIGGNPDTSFWESETETSPGWAVVGLGIGHVNGRASILTKSDWHRLLTQTAFDPNVLDGHFVALRWRSGRLECFADQLGLRTLYYAQGSGEICLSTRLDWVARAAGHSEVDWAALGSRWLLFNQLSYGSGVTGIERLGPGGYALFEDGSIVRFTANRPWLPAFEPESPETALGILRQLVQCALSHPYVPSLGLSGGLDSRVLLALFRSCSPSGFVTHTFGDDRDPDVQVAKRIAQSLGVPHLQLNEPLPDVQTCIREVRSFAARSMLIEPVTTYLKLRYYPELRRNGRLMIDGGFGEIARRQYLNRVVRLGQAALRNRETSRLLELMRAPRADVFSSEVTARLEAGALRSLEEALDRMPPVEKIGVENFVDLFAVRTRVPNFGGPEQARLDGEILNFMPLVQPRFLRAMFGVPAKQRSNAGIYYDTIRSLDPGLGRFPLVKSVYTYRFGLSSAASWLTVKLKSKLLTGYSDPKPDALLAHLQEYVMDLAHSQEVRTNPVYDARKLEAVTKYYRGGRHLRSMVDWWLAFELWRQSLS